MGASSLHDLLRLHATPALAREVFLEHYAQLIAGATGMIPEQSIVPVTTLPDADALGDDELRVGRESLDATVMIKLNGGLGTGMGLTGPKSLVTVRGTLSFLDLIVKHAIAAKVPLVLMNSFRTQEASLEVLKRYPSLSAELPVDFLQHRIPKIDRETLEPVRCAPEHAWCPPGHGDIYTALVTSGVLARLLASGKRYAFVSNADNLGATLDLRLLGAFVTSGSPFLMEVADRTPADRKGGHLAQQGDRLILRESAQCPEGDREAFQDISRHRYFNTNNLWIDLEALNRFITDNGAVVLPLIRNSKRANPRDPDSRPVYQLESAMGAAIGIFPGARAIRVSRTRFSPVKTTADLLNVRSDAYVLREDYSLVLHPDRQGVPPTITLDPAFFAFVPQLDERIPSPPSLIECERLTVVGDVRLSEGVIIKGQVELRATAREMLVVPSGLVTSQTEL